MLFTLDTVLVIVLGGKGVPCWKGRGFVEWLTSVEM